MIALLKLVGSLFYPLNTALVALALAVIARRRRPQMARFAGVFALAWLWLWSIPLVAERAAWTLERRYPPVSADQLPSADAIVLLGGFLDPAQPPFAIDPNLNGAADRAWLAAQLWHAGKAPRLICSSGLAPLSRASAPECPDAVRLLRDLGIPDSAIVVESASRTTRENAAETRQLLATDARVLLVTSAMHMPRSLASFRQAGIDAVPAPTDHVFRPDRPFEITTLLPSPSALATSTAVWHEWLGRLWYAVSE